MNITEPTSPTATRDLNGETAPPRGRRTDTFQPITRRETKASTKTTELWLTLIGVAVLAVIYNLADDASLNLFRACLLGTVMGAAYIVSRGFAKAGSRDDERETDAYNRA